MTALNQWTELLTCPKCGIAGLAHLSRPEKRAFDFNVDAIPKGFKVVSLKFGETFYCDACNHRANAK